MRGNMRLTFYWLPLTKYRKTSTARLDIEGFNELLRNKSHTHSVFGDIQS